MHPDDMRHARAIATRRRIELNEIAADILPRVGSAAETFGFFCVLCAFWGLIMFLALTAVLK